MALAEQTHESVVVELSALHEISSLALSDSLGNFGEEAMEKAVRLFGLRRFVLLAGLENDRQLLACWGFKDASNIRREIERGEVNQFHWVFGDGGELGELLMEQASPLGDREQRLYTIFARQVGEALRTARQVAERKRAQAEREILLKDLKEVNRRLEQSNQELQDFAYVASHDLREPLRKISSFGTLLQDSLEGKLDEDEQENFEFMIDGAKRMQTMINDLFTYSRISTRAEPFQQIDLNGVIENLKKLDLATLLDETKGTIHVPQPLSPVHRDPSQIRQLLQNLVGNGLKFHREGVPPEITIRAHIDDNMVELEVQDNGIGIAEEYHKQVFTMFKRLHSREHYGGTGIGLAVCQKIVDRHGGSIGVKSTPGEGSTFWFTLPREAAQQTNGERSNDHNG